jgi:hypothetical protein
MKTLAMVTLCAAAMLSVAGCHWGQRHWRDYRDNSYNSYHDGAHYVRNQQAAITDRDS